MRKTLFTLFAFLIIAFIAFLLLSTNGFLGENIGKTGEEISGKLDKVVNQGIGAITEFTGQQKQKEPPTPQEDPKITNFFNRLKTASPEDIADMVIKGFKPTQTNLAGDPPIVHMARYNNNPESYEIMLNIGASVEQTNRKGDNALKVAIERGAPIEVIRILYANQEALDEKVRQEKIKQGPGAQVISSYYPSLENGGSIKSF